MQRSKMQTQPSHTRGSLVAAHELPFIQQGENIYISANLLHKKLHSRQEFSNWIKRRIEKYGFQLNQDFLINLSKSTGGRRLTDYLLSMDMAKELAMLEENETGRQIRRYFIAKEKELRGIVHLPREQGLFKGICCKNVNSRRMVAWRPFLTSIGYPARSSGYNYRAGYPGHFITMGHTSFVSEELALYIYQQRRQRAARASLKAMQPVLPLNFGAPLQTKGGTHA